MQRSVKEMRQAAAAKYRAAAQRTKPTTATRSIKRDMQEAARNGVRANRAARRGTFENVITMANVPTKYGVTLNKQTYDPRALAKWLNSSNNPVLPTSRRRLTAEEIAMVRRMAKIANGAEGYHPLHTMFNKPPPGPNYTRGTGRFQMLYKNGNGLDRTLKYRSGVVNQMVRHREFSNRKIGKQFKTELQDLANFLDLAKRRYVSAVRGTAFRAAAGDQYAGTRKMIAAWAKFLKNNGTRVLSLRSGYVQLLQTGRGSVTNHAAFMDSVLEFVENEHSRIYSKINEARRRR